MASGYMSGYQKLDIAILPHTGTAETAVVSRPFDMSKYGKALFIVSAASMGSTGGNSTSAIIWGRVLQGLSTSTGTFVALWSVSSFSGLVLGCTGTKTLIPNAQAIVITAGSTPVTGDYITIWGKSSASARTYTFSTTISSTGVAASTDLLLSATSELANIALKLQNFINSDSTMGLGTELYTSAASTTVSAFTVRAKEAGESYVNSLVSVVTAASSGSLNQIIQESLGYASVQGSEISVSSSYRYIMLELTPSTACIISAMLIRGGARYSPTQYVSGYKVGGAT